jgi:ribosomal protein L7/L12
VIRDGLERDAALSIAAAFDGVATVRIESHVSVPAPGEPPPVPTVSLVLVSVARERRIQALKLVRELTGWGLAEAKQLVDEVTAGNPAAIRLQADAATASALVARFQGIAEVRVEHAPA